MPPALFCRGDTALLGTRCVALVGSRQLRPDNRRFAVQAGKLAAAEGFTLVSGGAAGADTAAQEACLAAGGRVSLPLCRTVCWIIPRGKTCCIAARAAMSCPFSTPRALARNCLIHAMGEKTLVAQCAEGTGGTWSGSQWNLRRGMSELYVFDDGSAASAALQSCGAERLPDIPASLALLRPFQLSIFDGKSDEKRKK